MRTRRIIGTVDADAPLIRREDFLHLPVTSELFAFLANCIPGKFPKVSTFR